MRTAFYRYRPIKLSDVSKEMFIKEAGLANLLVSGARAAGRGLGWLGNRVSALGANRLGRGISNLGTFTSNRLPRMAVRGLNNAANWAQRTSNRLYTKNPTSFMGSMMGTANVGFRNSANALSGAFRSARRPTLNITSRTGYY